MFRRMIGRPSPEVVDPVFGRMTYHARPAPCWEAPALRIDGFGELQVLVDGDGEGPTPGQRDLFGDLVARLPALDPRLQSAIRSRFAVQDDVDMTKPLSLSTIYLPADVRDGATWRVWYDLEDEDAASFGVEIDGWDEFEPFADD